MLQDNVIGAAIAECVLCYCGMHQCEYVFAMLDVSNDLQEPATSNRVINVESGFCFHLLHECLRFA